VWVETHRKKKFLQKNMSSDDHTKDEPKKNATDKSIEDLFYNVLPYVAICQALYTGNPQRFTRLCWGR